MKTKSESKNRPAILLWVVSYFSFFIFPLTMFINMVMIKFGLGEGILTFLVATGIAIMIGQWHSALTAEVNQYLIEKYSEDE